MLQQRRKLGERRCRSNSSRRLHSLAAAAVAAAAALSLSLLVLLPAPVAAARPLLLPPMPRLPSLFSSGDSSSAEELPQREEQQQKKQERSAAAAAEEPDEREKPASGGDHEAAYGHFADLLASVLVLREGGVSEALDALPMLHDTTHAYVRTLAIIRAQEAKAAAGSSASGGVLGPASAWRGLTDAAVRNLANKIPNTTKYANYTDPLAASGQQLQAALDDKWGPEPALGWERRWRWKQLENTISKAIPDSANDDPLIADLNAKLSQYNVEVSAKHVMEPSRFHNAAAVISKNLAGLHLMDSAFTFAPCLVSVHAAPLMLHGTGINVAPSAIGVMATGAMAWPQGVNLQPALVFIAPMGANAQPQGVQVAPYLVAVSPMGANAQPQGIQIAPVGRAEMSTGALSQPQGTVVSPVGSMAMQVGQDVTPGGSYMMAHHNHEAGGHEGHEMGAGAGGSGDEHAGHDMASMDHAGHSRRRGLLSEQKKSPKSTGDAKKSEGKIVFSDDPLDLSNEMPSDYRNWASVLSQVLLAKEGGGGAGGMMEQGGGGDDAKALAALDALTLATRARLSRAAAGDVAEPLLPRFHLTDPVFQAMDHMDHSAEGHGHSMGEGKSMLTGVHAMSSFINYAPCVLGEHVGGAMVETTGLRFAPSLLSVMVSAFEGRAEGINFEPRLIYIQPMGANAQPQGVNVQPALVYIGPMGANVQPQGINIQPVLDSVMPMGANSQPQGIAVAPADQMRMNVGVLNNPISGSVYAPVGEHVGM